MFCKTIHAWKASSGNSSVWSGSSMKIYCNILKHFMDDIGRKLFWDQRIGLFTSATHTLTEFTSVVFSRKTIWSGLQHISFRCNTGKRSSLSQYRKQLKVAVLMPSSSRANCRMFTSHLQKTTSRPHSKSCRKAERSISKLKVTITKDMILKYH